MAPFRTVIDRFRALSKEQRTRYVNRFGYGTSALMVFLIVLLMGGERTAPLREALGLGWIIAPNDRPKAMYGDCSKPENRSLPACKGKERARLDSEWKGLKHRESGQSPPFSLYGR